LNSIDFEALFDAHQSGTRAVLSLPGDASQT
jgi:hypothetical protein